MKSSISIRSVVSDVKRGDSALSTHCKELGKHINVITAACQQIVATLEGASRLPLPLLCQLAIALSQLPTARGTNPWPLRRLSPRLAATNPEEADAIITRLIEIAKQHHPISLAIIVVNTSQAELLIEKLTRASKRLEWFGNFQAGELKITAGTPLGVMHLHKFLEQNREVGIESRVLELPVKQKVI